MGGFVMEIDPELAKIGVTILGTFSTTMIAVGKVFHGNICDLTTRIAKLSESINALDKNVAVQSAILKQHIEASNKFASPP
jgi:Holliday junction resolvasome RuvABC endonuclease subunit